MRPRPGGGGPAFWVLLLSGVFERHPGLRYSIAENGAWWVPDIVTRMNEKWDGGHNTRKFGDVFRSTSHAARRLRRPQLLLRGV